MSNGQEEFEARRLRRTTGNSKRWGAREIEKKNTYTNKKQKIKATEETRRDQGIVVARV